MVPGLIPPDEKTIVNFTFYNSIVQVMKSSMTWEYFCCCRCHKTTESIPRHKILGYDFTADEWCCTVCCFKNEKFLELGMMNGEKIFLQRPKPGVFNNTDWPEELPETVRNYVFSPLDSVGERAQLLSHMIGDGISKKAALKLPLTGPLPPPVKSSGEATELFQVSYGKKGQGRFSMLRFSPGYLSMEWGDSPYCNKPCCCIKNLANVLSHNTVSAPTVCLWKSVDTLRPPTAVVPGSLPVIGYPTIRYHWLPNVRVRPLLWHLLYDGSCNMLPFPQCHPIHWSNDQV